jgi:hypothetical protein
MWRPHKIDANQKAIVASLRQAGAFVEVLSDVGRGVPDLLIGWQQRWVLVELKRPGALSLRKLTPYEARWHKIARARRLPVFVAQSFDEIAGRIGMAEPWPPIKIVAS